MLITAALLYAYNGIEQKEDETSQQLIEIHIGTAQQIISNYVLFDCETVLTNPEHFDSGDVLWEGIVFIRTKKEFREIKKIEKSG